MRTVDDWHLTEEVVHELGRGDPFAAAIRGTRMPMVITDPRQPDNPIVFANAAFETLTGYDHEEIIGRNCRFLQGMSSDRRAAARIRAAVAVAEPINVDILNYRKDGSAFWNALYISPVRGEDGEVQFFFASQLDVTERIEAQRLVIEQKARVEAEVRARTADLEAALEAKTTLLHEVDHRVKNNLMMIGSLIRLQARALPDPRTRRSLETMLERIDALAAVHRRLYQDDDIRRFKLDEFAVGLARDVLGASGREGIELETQVEPLDIPSRAAAPIGLMLNELITNAIKHAWPDGRAGTLRLAIRRADGHAEIDVADNGPGFDPAQANDDAIGLSLVRRLARQVRGEAVWQASAAGTSATLRFPLAD